MRENTVNHLCRFVLAACVWAVLGRAATVPIQAAEPPGNNTIYEILVRSFYDSNGDGVGDLQGLTQRLDYLNDGKPQTNDDLEVGILWLMPIFPSARYHGYSVDNYRDIHPQYGTLADFDALVAATHQRGVRIILDIPFNHTSNQHPWFKDAVQKPSTSPYREYYHLVVDHEPYGNNWHWVVNDAGQKVHYFGLFGSDMPDLNMANEKVKVEVKEVAKFWLSRGVDGFRLDAAKHIFGWSMTPTWDDILKNNAWWKDFSEYVRSIKPSAVVVGEVLGDTTLIHHFAWGLDWLLDPPFMSRVRAFSSSPSSGLIGWWTDYLAYARKNNSRFNLMPYVSSHDENPRLASFLKKEAPQRSEQAYRLAMYLLLTMGKYPVLYYGDEVMQEGWKWNGSPPPDGDGSQVYDETLREPFPWYAAWTGPGQTSWFRPRFDGPNDGVSVEEQASRGDSLLSLVRALTNFRAAYPDFADGETTSVLNDAADWAVFEKKSGGSAYLVLVRTADTASNYRFHEGWHPEYRDARVVFKSDGVLRKWEDTSAAGLKIEGSVDVPPAGLVILKTP